MRIDGRDHWQCAARELTEEAEESSEESDTEVLVPKRVGQVRCKKFLMQHD